MAPYTGDTQRLGTASADDASTFLLHLLTRAPFTDTHATEETRSKIYAQRQLLEEARDYLNTARRYLEDFARFQATAEKVKPESLPASVRAFLMGMDGQGV